MTERSRLQWAGHVERMADDRLPKRVVEFTRGGQDETINAKAECKEDRRGGRLEEEDTRQRRVKILSYEALEKLRVAPQTP